MTESCWTRLRPARAAQGLDLFGDPEQVLDMVADLVGDDVGLGEIPGRTEPVLQVA